jgi:hypothetical protein
MDDGKICSSLSQLKIIHDNIKTQWYWEETIIQIKDKQIPEWQETGVEHFSFFPITWRVFHSEEAEQNWDRKLKWKNKA